MNELSIVTVCRGRLEQLKQTLPRMLDFRVPVIVVDYDCPELNADTTRLRGSSLVENLRFIQSGPRPYMNLNEARNIGIRSVETPVVLMIDCDVMIRQREFMEYAEHIVFSRQYVVNRPPSRSLSGTAMFRLSDYVAVGGYDEVLNRYGAGYDELDFYYKLNRAGVQSTHFASDLFEHIPHEGRADHYPLNNRGLSDEINYLYLVIKTELLGVLGNESTELDVSYRVVLMDRIYKAVMNSVLLGTAAQLDVDLHGTMVGSMMVRRAMHYSIDTDQILSKCRLTVDQFCAIVDRVSKVRPE